MAVKPPLPGQPEVDTDTLVGLSVHPMATLQSAPSLSVDYRGGWVQTPPLVLMQRHGGISYTQRQSKEAQALVRPKQAPPSLGPSLPHTRRGLAHTTAELTMNLHPPATQQQTMDEMQTPGLTPHPAQEGSGNSNILPTLFSLRPTTVQTKDLPGHRRAAMP